MKTMAFRPRTESFAAKCPVEAPATADLTVSRAMSSADVCHLSMPTRIKKWNDSFSVEQSPFPTNNINMMSGLISQQEVDARRELRKQRRAQMQAVSDAFVGDDTELSIEDIQKLAADRSKSVDTRQQTADGLSALVADKPMAQEASYDDILNLDADRTEAQKQADADRREQLRTDALAALADVGTAEAEDAQKAAIMISASLTEAGDSHFQHTFTLGMNGRPSIGLAGRDPAAEHMMRRGVAAMTDDEKVGAYMHRM